MYHILYYIVLYYIILLYWITLDYIITLCHIALYFRILYVYYIYIELYHVTFYYIILHYITLYYIILHNITFKLFHIVLHCIIYLIYWYSKDILFQPTKLWYPAFFLLTKYYHGKTFTYQTIPSASGPTAKLRYPPCFSINPFLWQQLSWL